MAIIFKNITTSIKKFLRKASFLLLKKSFFYHIALLFGAMFVFSCEEPILTDTDLLTVDDLLSVTRTDTSTIFTFTENEEPQFVIDPILTNITATAIVGNMDDPDFGQTYAGFYSRLKLPTNNVNFGDSAGANDLVLDSIVLSFRYSGKYGPFNASLDFVVYEVEEALNPHGGYKSDQAFQVATPELGRIDDHFPNINDSVNVNGDFLPSHLRIPLDNSFGEKLLNESGGANLADNEAFHEFFKGIYVTTNTSNTGDGVVYFNLQSAVSGLSLYYRIQDQGVDTDTLSFQFIFDNELETINHYDHFYDGANAEQFIDKTSLTGDSACYVQSLSGLIAKIEIPFLKNFSEKAVNKAALTFSQLPDASGNDTLFDSPAGMILFRIDDAGEIQLISDFELEGGAHFGGSKETISIDGEQIHQYSFNLTRYVQQIINGELNNNGLYLKTFPSNFIGNRVILGGGTHSKHAPKLDLVFTNIN